MEPPSAKRVCMYTYVCYEILSLPLSVTSSVHSKAKRRLFTCSNTKEKKRKNLMTSSMGSLRLRHSLCYISNRFCLSSTIRPIPLRRPSNANANLNLMMSPPDDPTLTYLLVLAFLCVLVSPSTHAPVTHTAHHTIRQNAKRISPTSTLSLSP